MGVWPTLPSPYTSAQARCWSKRSAAAPTGPELEAVLDVEGRERLTFGAGYERGARQVARARLSITVKIIGRRTNHLRESATDPTAR